VIRTLNLTTEPVGFMQIGLISLREEGKPKPSCKFKFTVSNLAVKKDHQLVETASDPHRDSSLFWILEFLIP